ncbi:MAG: ChaN family lipoprotein [Oligoflexia bacterium]|nr:ChaN family lipoprotein [Oligoflexia bacterium]MBF0364432.1 ChaN family lipoprotein [Oligoflexia bacterium]
MQLKSQIIKIHDLNYKKTKQQAQELLEDYSPLLRSYQKDHENFSKRPFELSSIKKLFQAINSSNIILVGDFHTFEQNAKNFERLLKYCTLHRLQFVVALELLMASHQHFVHQFMLGETSEVDFLENIQYDKNWMFPWSHYRGIFHIAKEAHAPVFAINSKGNLCERDQFAADTLSSIRKQYPDKIILVLIGEMHIVSNKLPQALCLSLKNKKISATKITTIHQNLDHVYKQLQVTNTKNAVVQFTSKRSSKLLEFCLQTALPWSKYESMLYWIECIGGDSRAFDGNIENKFIPIIKQLQSFLQLEEFITDEELENFIIYNRDKNDFILKEIQKIKQLNLRQLAEHLLTNGKSFKLPYSSKLYSAHYSMNKLSYLAGVCLFDSIYKQLDLSYDDLLESAKASRFIALMHQHITSYLCSKILNPHRKCDLYKDLCLKLSAPAIDPYIRKVYIESIKIIDACKETEEGNDKKWNESIFALKHSLPFINDVATLTGHIFAELLFEKLYEMDYKIAIHHLKNLLFVHPLGVDDLKEISDFLFKQTKLHLLQKKIF